MFLHPKYYYIAMHKDGELFRVDKEIIEQNKTTLVLIHDFLILKPNRKSQLINDYFDVFGNLRKKYWALKRITLRQLINNKN